MCLTSACSTCLALRKFHQTRPLSAIGFFASWVTSFLEISLPYIMFPWMVRVMKVGECQWHMAYVNKDIGTVVLCYPLDASVYV